MATRTSDIAPQMVGRRPLRDLGPPYMTPHAPREEEHHTKRNEHNASPATPFVPQGVPPAATYSRAISNSCSRMNASASLRLKTLSVAPIERTQLAPKALPQRRQPAGSSPFRRPAI